MSATIQNPILPGFHPDPSIVRVGEDYFIATSTFEWFPGVEIHHSRDLVNWRLAARPLTRISQLDLRGVPNSGGVWAPDLSYCDGLFYLCYTNARCHSGPWFDTPNFLATAARVDGDWSEPVPLNASGFDPSLFHDPDGRKWLLNMEWDWRGNKNPNSFAGILLQEYDVRERKLVGSPRNIFKGTRLGITEGPHLYRIGAFYYLLTAEGGTGYEHAVTIARSERIEGPYEVDPENPVLTTVDAPTHPIQKAGHGDLVRTPSGEWYLAHLGSRPLPGTRRCVLGRETFIQKMELTKDGWIRLAQGGRHPRMTAPAPAGVQASAPPESKPRREDFDGAEWPREFQSLRRPLGEDASLSARPGFLRLIGRESLSSLHLQTLVGRRQEHWSHASSAALEFDPSGPKQMAGLSCYYNAENYFYLAVTANARGERILVLISADRGRIEFPLGSLEIRVPRRCVLRAESREARLQFSWSPDGREWLGAGPALDASRLSDDHCGPMAFTGAFVALACQDLSGRGAPADFDWFEYSEI